MTFVSKKKHLQKRARLRRATCASLATLVCVLMLASVLQIMTSPVTLFIALGTKPSNFELRDALRKTWLVWAKADSQTRYAFFTEVPKNAHDAKRLRLEARKHGDVVLQRSKGGYRAFSSRGLFQMRYALKKHPKLLHYLRVDDDTFLCYRKLRWELQYRPKTRFFWGKYFCRSGKHCADENFMLFSIDVVKRVLLGVDKHMLRIHWNNTLARNFGLWSRNWTDLTIFDDRDRFDVQQGLLTDYMHERGTGRPSSTYARFCARYMFAHWVKSPAVMRAVYKSTDNQVPLNLPRVTSNVEGCPDPSDRTIHPL